VVNRVFARLITGLAMVGSVALVRADLAFDRYVADIVILQDRMIQKEIGVTDAQRSKMNSFAEADRKKREALMKQFQKEAEAAQKAGKQYRPEESKVVALNVALKDNVIKVLTPAQTKRLRELTLQNAGITCLMDPKVAKEVGVAPATVTKLRNLYQEGLKKAAAIQEAAAKQVSPEFKDKKPKSQEEAQKLQQQFMEKVGKIAGPKVQEVTKKTQAAMVALLSKANKDKLIALQGPALK
jgi:hypothetical protein